jgi:hypothetical protein
MVTEGLLKMLIGGPRIAPCQYKISACTPPYRSLSAPPECPADIHRTFRAFALHYMGYNNTLLLTSRTSSIA